MAGLRAADRLIFGQHGFATSVGTVKTRGRERRQYDVIARRGSHILLAECKQWSGKRYRISALKQAAGTHRERAAFYESVTGEAAVPLIVVLVEEEIRIFEGVPLVPVHRLNAFLGELDRFLDGFSFSDPEGEEEEGAIPDLMKRGGEEY